MVNYYNVTEADNGKDAEKIRNKYSQVVKGRTVDEFCRTKLGSCRIGYNHLWQLQPHCYMVRFSLTNYEFRFLYNFQHI